MHRELLGGILAVFFVYTVVVIWIFRLDDDKI